MEIENLENCRLSKNYYYGFILMHYFHYTDNKELLLLCYGSLF